MIRINPVYENALKERDQTWGFLPPHQNVLQLFKNIENHIEVKNILEIGFNCGFSCSYQLSIHENAKMHSYDPQYGWSVLPPPSNQWMREIYPERYTIIPGSASTNRYKGFSKTYGADLARLVFGSERFTFHEMSSENILDNHSIGDFDYAFIDGDHNYEGVSRDIKNCLQLEIPYLVIDNVTHSGVARAIEDYSSRLETIQSEVYTVQHPRYFNDVTDGLVLYRVKK